MSTPLAPWFDVRVYLEDGAHVDHTYSIESDARYYLADCQAQGYRAELIVHSVPACDEHAWYTPYPGATTYCETCGTEK